LVRVGSITKQEYGRLAFAHVLLSRGEREFDRWLRLSATSLKQSLDTQRAIGGLWPGRADDRLIRGHRSTAIPPTRKDSGTELK
jgi:hypothetical protein